MTQMAGIVLPPKRPGESNETWEDVQSVVVTGANGSGKSRFGVWIEENNPERQVHRIAAQRALHLPDLINPAPYERATAELYYGFHNSNLNELQYRQQKLQNRWRGEPLTQILADSEKVVSVLFAEQTKRDHDYTTAAQKNGPTRQPPDCNLDVLKRIWSKIYPHRALVIEQDRVLASIPETGQAYAGRMMSDGERVAFYLLGQVLCAPKSSILIIDEPEIHLHRAIQSALWDEAEGSRSDCTFVYITHDLEFAASRSEARKIWTKNFDGTKWDWDELVQPTEVPEELVLQVLGNRRPVLFVEGDLNSRDSALYRALYPEKLVVPLASCDRVIGARRGMQQLSSLHNLVIEGLVDRDHRSDEEIGALRIQGIKVGEVAEVENLFCIPEAVSAVAGQLRLAKPEDVLEAVKRRVIDEFRNSMDTQVAARALAEVQFRLTGFGPKAGKATASMIQSELSNYLAKIDIDGIFKKSSDLLGSIASSSNYDAVLRVFNNKGIISFVAAELGIKPQVYCAIVLGIVRSLDGVDLASKLRSRIA